MGEGSQLLLILNLVNYRDSHGVPHVAKNNQLSVSTQRISISGSPIRLQNASNIFIFEANETRSYTSTYHHLAKNR